MSSSIDRVAQHLEAHVFDRLQEVVDSTRRSTAEVEAAGVLEGAKFIRNLLEDNRSSRASLFRTLSEEEHEPSLVFFDPDIGRFGTLDARDDGEPT